MSIVFKKLTYKNFLSTGNSPNVINLDESPATLITGQSGHGKSTIADALVFGLFGRAFRDINRQNLINSINGKQLEVIVEFRIDQIEYKIIRGMKPNRFEIYKNGELIQQDAAVRDYQKVLEQTILRLNYKVFCQTVILGSASFVPFMQLNAASRREIIEEILDIKIFTAMNLILKERIQTHRDESTRLDSSIERKKVLIAAQNKIIQSAKTIQSDSIESWTHKIDDANEEIASIEDRMKTTQDSLNELSIEFKLLHGLRETKSKLEQEKSVLLREVQGYETRIAFMETSSECHHCLQPIEHSHKVNKIDESLSEIKSIWSKIHAFDAKINLIQNEINDHNTTCNPSIINTLQLSYSSDHSSIKMLNKQITYANQEITKLRQKDHANLQDESQTLKNLATEVVQLIEGKQTLAAQKKIHDVVSILLKDSGIKTVIIKNYLPLMNKMINFYLQHLDLYIQFELDEGFNEQIRSRYRDEFTYANFSEGEKARINIAILFAWREIARMKNSINTNLLILDETLDSHLDDSSMESFMGLIDTIKTNTNVFIISHKNTMNERFDRIIEVHKVHDFTVF